VQLDNEISERIRGMLIREEMRSTMERQASLTALVKCNTSEL
jgi:hypothetical protein